MLRTFHLFNHFFGDFRHKPSIYFVISFQKNSSELRLPCRVVFAVESVEPLEGRLVCLGFQHVCTHSFRVDL